MPTQSKQLSKSSSLSEFVILAVMYNDEGINSFVNDLDQIVFKIALSENTKSFQKIQVVICRDLNTIQNSHTTSEIHQNTTIFAILAGESHHI